LAALAREGVMIALLIELAALSLLVATDANSSGE
jgi:hypothetical protein